MRFLRLHLYGCPERVALVSTGNPLKWFALWCRGYKRHRIWGITYMMKIVMRTSEHYKREVEECKRAKQA